MTRRQLKWLIERGAYLPPTYVRYSEPYLDDLDAEARQGKYRLSRYFANPLQMASKEPRLKLLVGSGADGETIPHGEQALGIIALAHDGGFTPAEVLQATTLNNAEVMVWKGKIWSIEVRKYADLISTNYDILENI